MIDLRINRVTAAAGALRIRLRRPPRAVLWGGRECDRWIGSPEDLALAELERRLSARSAQHALAMRRLADVGARQAALVAQVGVSSSQALEALSAMGAALDRALEQQRPAIEAALESIARHHAGQRRQAAEVAQRIGAAELGRPWRPYR